MNRKRSSKGERQSHCGEIHSDDQSGKEMQQTIEALLAEKECAS